MKDHGPEWKYVAIVEEKEKGNPKVQCCFCDKIFIGGSSQICEHLHGEKKRRMRSLNLAPMLPIQLFKRCKNWSKKSVSQKF